MTDKDTDPFTFDDPDGLPAYIRTFNGIADRAFQGSLYRHLQKQGHPEQTIAQGWPLVSDTLRYIQTRKGKR